VKILTYIQDHKYEILLVGLVQHLFLGIFLKDLVFYTNVLWEVSLMIIGICSLGVFIDKGKWKNFARLFIFFLGLLLPISFSVLDEVPYFMDSLSIIYLLFFSLILWEVMAFLIKPSYINPDIISACLCGYFLLIEINVFLMQFLYYRNPESISNIDPTTAATVYIDLVYFCTIVQTTIGFGDIAPVAHNTKLATALFGLIGQFYSVVLIGILLSKFGNQER